MNLNDPQPVVPDSALVELLYTDMDRGRAFYLDGITDALIRSARVRLVRRQSSVLEHVRGLSRLAWKISGWFCRHESSGGPIGSLSRNVSRKPDYNRGGAGLRLLARDLTRRFEDGRSPLLVAHPLLVAVLRGRQNLIYQHGEPIVPQESLVRGAGHVLVPTRAAADRFLGADYSSGQLFVSGLCIESALVRQAGAAFEERFRRLSTGGTLTGAFYGSSVEPKPQVERLIEAAWSTVTAGHRALVFAPLGGRLAHRTIQRFLRIGADFLQVRPDEPIGGGSLPRATLVMYGNRREEYALTARLFAEFDFLVAPAHERSNWALGLGVPILVVGPETGSLAQLTRKLLVDSRVAMVLDSRAAAEAVGESVRRRHRSGELAAMAEAGWQRRDINGFAAIADWLDAEFSAT